MAGARTMTAIFLSFFSFHHLECFLLENRAKKRVISLTTMFEKDGGPILNCVKGPTWFTLDLYSSFKWRGHLIRVTYG